MRLEHEGFSYDEIYDRLQLNLDDFIQRNSSYACLVEKAKAAKEYFKCLVEKKIPDVGVLVLRTGNDAVHSNLQTSDIITEINGHPVMYEKEVETFRNHGKGAVDVLTRLRFRDGNPVLDNFTDSLESSNVLYIDLRE